MGRWVTVIGVIISIGTAFLVMQAQSIMDYVQALFSFFIAPLFGTVILGMLWKRTTPAAGWTGLLAGTLSSVGMYVWVKLDPGAVRYVALSMEAQDQAQNMFRALWCCLICVIVTVVVSYMTKPKPESELKDLVYGLTPIPKDDHVSMFHSPVFWGVIVAVAFVILQIIFW
jgi:SSS family solute:Na+ symporter